MVTTSHQPLQRDRLRRSQLPRAGEIIIELEDLEAEITQGLADLKAMLG